MIGVFAAMVLGIVLVIGFTGKGNAVTGAGSGTTHGSGDGVAIGSDPGSAGPGSSATGPGSSATGPGSSATGPGSSATIAGGAAGPGSATVGSIPADAPDKAIGSAEGPAGSGGARAGSGGAGTAVTVEPNVEIDVISAPSGAHIFVDGADTGKLTPHTLSFPKMTGKVVITLHLKGYNSTSLKVDSTESSQQRIELVKVKIAEPPPARCRTSERAGCARDPRGCCIPEGSGSGSGSRAGSGTKTGSGDAGKVDRGDLMRPE